MVNVNGAGVRRIAYRTLDKISPGLFLPLEPGGEIGENFPLNSI